MTRRIALILAAALALSGCSSFRLGGMVYCPHGMACSFQQVPPTPVNVHVSPAAPAASGTSA